MPRTAVTPRRPDHQIFTNSSPHHFPWTRRPSVGWPRPVDTGRAASLRAQYSPEEFMILRKTVLAAGALAALLVSASVGSAKPTATAKSSAAAPVQCSTKLMTLRPHYPDPVKPFAGAASSLSGAGSTFVAPIM